MISTVEQLEQQARELALIHHPGKPAYGSVTSTRKALRRHLEMLRAFAAGLKQVESSALQPAEHWLLDHADFIEAEAFAVREELAGLTAGGLARLRPGNEPRAKALCGEYVKRVGGELDVHSFERFVHAYQEVAVLSVAEVAALPVLLRVSMIAGLAELMEVVRERREAYDEVDKLLAPFADGGAKPDAGKIKEALDAAGYFVPLAGPVVVHLVSRLNEWADELGDVRHWLLCKLDNGAEDFNRLLVYEHQLQASYEWTAGNLIRSLRAMSRTRWDSLFERLSVVERTLGEERAGMYARMDERSRATLREQVERLAQRYGMPENVVARQAVALADRRFYAAERPSEAPAAEETRSAGTEPEGGLPPRSAYAAYYLLESKGRGLLRESLRECGQPKRLFGRMVPYPQPGPYLAAMTALFAAFLALALWLTAAANGGLPGAGAWIAAGLLLALPASEWTVTAVHSCLERLFIRRPLLRYDYASGIPEDAATITVIPVIWSKPDDAVRMADRLELHYLSSPDRHMGFALLGDFTDAVSEHAEADEEIVAAARKRIEELNALYGDPDTGTGPFYLFQRSRRWNETERTWMGWERKRGKLVEFVELLSGKTDTSYAHIVGDGSRLASFRYVLTLDADTELPIGAARRMVATMHLPYNRARLNAAATRVTEGYGVLQPRVGISYDSVTVSRLARLWSSKPGIDPYAFAMSDPYQNAFGQGIFTGKGLFDVTAFRQVLNDRIPDNRVLSHDLLEGGFLRGGLLTDIEVVDGHPATFYSYQQRQHRWVRGDWQLLCWLAPRVSDRCGQSQPVDLSVLTRWQIADNMRRSLVQPGLYLLFAASLLMSGGAGWLLFAAGLLTLMLGIVRSLLAPRYLMRNPAALLAAAGQSLTQFIVLPYQAAVMADAIVRTLFRVGVSKKRLLEWTSSAEVERRSRVASRSAMMGAWGGRILVLAFAACAFAAQPPALRAFGLAIAVLWLLAPLAVQWLNSPPKVRAEEGITAGERERLHELAAQIWAYYEDFAVEGDNWLPPDNVQLEPPNGVAHRTSPTNIGLGLVCAVAARDFGFIDTPGLLERVERTVGTIERMEKWNGHLYNWYDTESLRPLPPLYVSTVDSGNFVAYLIALTQGVLEWGARDEEQHGASVRERAGRLAERIEAIVRGTDFRPLYDEESELFSLGYQAALDRRETILYDLLASEARQASFLAIAFGQAPVSHWFRLGRAMARSGGRPTLLSWSGTMFEYLMPSLLMRTYRNTVWDATYRGVVRRQIEYGRQRGVPFGISESGYHAYDYQMNYQYRAFGVPGLGFQRGLENDLVLAPYAAIMALPFETKESLASLARMEQMGAKGPYGFYEAIDCTEQRLPSGSGHVVIRSFMAHHLGMSLLTLGNMLLPRTMIDRFHADKRVQAAELLLQERIPERPAIIKDAAKPAYERAKEPLMGTRIPLREFAGPAEAPEACVLSNGAFTTVVTDSGAGYSRWETVNVSRWHEDPVAETPGSCLYIRDVSTGEIWSPTFEPCRVPAEEQRAQFALDKATFSRRDGSLLTELDICVPPDQNAELRRLSLTNTGTEARIVEITAYVELSLSAPAADEAHPAFSKLFVQTEYEADRECLLAYRRPRSDGEKTKWAVGRLSIGCEALGPIEYETDRARFIGRGHTLARPASLECRLSGTVGAVLDPAFVMRRRVSIQPGETVRLLAVTGAADSREEALAIADGLCGERQAERAFQLAWTHSRIDLRHQHMTAMEAADYHAMAGRLLMQAPLREERERAIAANRSGQPGLWPLGISGDLPVALVKIQDKSQMPFARKMLVGRSYLRGKGIGFDLVFLIEQAGGYYQDVLDELRRAIEQTVGGTGAGGGIYPLMADRLSPEQADLLAAIARLTLRADGASLKAQLAARPKRRKRRYTLGEAPQADSLPTIEGLPADYRLLPLREEEEAHSGYKAESDPAPDPGPLELSNGWGGFAEDGREYRIAMRGGKYLPAPWSNVMANPHFGCLVTELGTGYTWWRNSREFKLTPWSNDPVLDPPGEALYIHDEESGGVWSASPSPELGKGAFEADHGFGYSRFSRQTRGIRHRMTIYVNKDEPVKYVALELENEGDAPRSLSVAYYCNWVLGVRRPGSASYIVSEWDAESGSLFARNGYQEHFRDSLAFLHMHARDDRNRSDDAEEAVSYTADRAEFIGRSGTLAQPEGMSRAKLSDTDGIFADSCGAIRLQLTLPPRGKRTVYVLLGAGESKEALRELVGRYRTGDGCDQALAEVTAFWRDTLGQIEVSTPSRELDLMLNGWLLYQALSCRMWARTAFYQAGGAYGFRDQLQDSLALLHTAPALTRRQIVLHAGHQYEEGDVQHWWHEETGRGIRTRYTDDLLWLPYAVSRYIVHTGDLSILDEIAPFLTSGELTDEEHERYEETVISPRSASVYEHCVRAIERASRYGEHGIPLMGIGDWNDGMNSVGDKGKGESVWLGWFLCEVLEKFADTCARKGDEERAASYRERRSSIAQALNEHAWDGEWYRRAFTDEGTWLGSTSNGECRIDAIAQSWSAISEAAPIERARRAMQSFDRELVDRDVAVARLLTPPFDNTDPSPGYIQGYPPGIRENGAQYTHGAIWSIVAWSKLGEGDKAFELFQLLNPVNHARSSSDVRVYAGEPYVIAADVYTREPVMGRAGWTWYTGASGWMYQAGVEWLLGLRREADKLLVQPAVPADWPSFEVRYRFGSAVYRIVVHTERDGAANSAEPRPVTLDGRPVGQTSSGGTYIPLADDGREHEAVVGVPQVGSVVRSVQP
ncbi:GH36-type glycosyl hydrolase domain-containing protein [Paenibacillus hodogayensis]|uniref:GH36-type glycosyl hydrolase domain-containing protein n=1 Tax=Paenibacillus hodogayensis TaxID=279208 RepID=A0ABV5VV99_9BACL